MSRSFRNAFHIQPFDLSQGDPIDSRSESISILQTSLLTNKQSVRNTDIKLLSSHRCADQFKGNVCTRLRLGTKGNKIGTKQKCVRRPISTRLYFLRQKLSNLPLQTMPCVSTENAIWQISLSTVTNNIGIIFVETCLLPKMQ